ncbi:MAG TPA: MotA/TolQ/ExbB proton channel family protein [Armatimonadota bacterium]|nr:MotA/TolQ/ExbB proton channel family protein [Armatimonadota bacterium]
MSLLSLLEQGGISLIPLGICSVLVIAVILERIWAFGRVGRVPKELMQRIESLIAAGQWYDAVRLLDDYDLPYTRIVKVSLLHKDASQQEINDILALACESELSAAVKPLPVLGTIGNIAPFIGLFGTVLGIMHAFRSVASHGSAGSSVVSHGISEALIATAIGLGVGIVAVVANNWFNAWIERYRLDLERFSTEWSYRLCSLRQSSTITEPVA